MKHFVGQVWTLYRKDLLTELREPDHFVSLLLFGVLLLLLFGFALSVEPELMQKMAPGLFWLAILFASILTLERSFQKETEDGQWEGLLLMGIDVRALYLGKVLSNLSLILLLQIALLPLMGILFDISLTGSLLLILILGSLGIVIPGTCYAALTSTLRGGQVLLPLLLYPMLVPVLLASVKVTQLTLAHDLFGQRLVWMKLLILFDIVFLLGSLLTAETLFDKA
jgi:heme exporter protein B